MNDDDNDGLRCTDVHIFTAAAMEDRGVPIKMAFLIQVRRTDGYLFDMLIPSYASLVHYLDYMQPQRTVVFRGQNESSQEFALLMNDVEQNLSVVLH